jgi:WD40 repeat protein
MDQRPVVPPSEEELQTFSLGKCEPPRAAEIEAFLTDGPDCSAVLGAAPEDALVRHLRGAAELHPAASRAAHVPGYDVLAEVGRGGMGVVYKARQVALNRLVALKMILAGSHAGPDELVRFRQEAETVARLQHPNIVQIYEVGDHHGLPYLALEYVDGGTLAQQTAGAPQPPAHAAALVELLARAVDYAHQQGVIHRDLKPANVLLTAAGAPKLSDFGLARLAGDAPGLTATGAIVGTPGYLAPEQADAERKALGPHTDVYGLGAVLYYLLTGRPPVQAATVAEIIRRTCEEEPVRPALLRPGVSRDLETICLKCLQKDPARRYATGLALAEDLRRFQAGEPIAARPVGPLERGWRWCRRHPAVALPSAAAVLLLLAVSAVSVVFAVAQGRAAVNLQAEKDRAQAALKQSRSNEALLTGDRANRLCEEGEDGQAPDLCRGLLWLTRAVELAPADDEHLQDLLRANWAACADRLCPLRGMLAPPQLELPHRSKWAHAAWSTDGRRVLAGSANGLEIWDVRDWRQVAALPSAGSIAAVGWSPDGQRVAGAATAGGSVCVWDPDSGASLPLQAPAPVNDLSFSHDSRLLAGACADGTVPFWDARTGQPAGEPLRLQGKATSVAFHPHQPRLVTTTETEVRQWDAASRTPLGPALGPFGKATARHARYSPDGTLFSFCVFLPEGGERGVYVHATDSGKMRHHLDVLADCAHLAPDGHHLAVGLDPSRTDVWAFPDTGASPLFNITGHQHIAVAAYAPDGRSLLTASTDGRVRVSALPDDSSLPPLALPLRGRKQALDIPYMPEGIRCLAVSPDGRLLFAGGWDRDGLLVGTADGSVRGTVTGHEHVIMAAAFIPDGQRLLTGSADQTVRLWDVGTCQPLAGPWKCPQPVISLALSPDGARALVCLWKGRPQVLQLPGPDGKGGGLSPGPRGWSQDGAFLPDGQALLGQLSGANLWDVVKLQPTGRELEHTTYVSAVAVDAEGRRAATGAWVVGRVWDLRTGSPIGAPLRHRERFKAVAFSPDGRVLASLGWTGDARFWDAATGRPIGPPLQHPGFGNALVFQPDGSAVLVGSSTRLVYRWRVPRPVADDAGRLALRAQVLTGMELDAEGVVRPLDPDTWRERRRRLEELDAGTGR